MSAAVDQVTDSMAAATITDPSITTANAEGTNAQIDAVNAIVAEGRRLYIGNLAYATTEGDLNEFFKGFLVESTSIPVNPRTTRPVGYAFVDLSTATEAQRAIAELSGKEVINRKVSVQLARKPEATTGEKTEGTSGGEGVSGGEGRRRNAGRGRGRGRGRAGRAGRGGRGQKSVQANGTTDTGVLPLTDTTTEVANTQNIQEGVAATAAATSDKDNKPRTPRQTKQRGPPEDGIPSKTKVMVANLPYDLTEDKLKELFSSYGATSAKLALRPIPRFMVKKLQARGEARKGRGFGFVTLETEESQKKAVAEMNGKEIEGREIAVKVAIDSPGKENTDAEGTAVDSLQENGVTGSEEAPVATA